MVARFSLAVLFCLGLGASALVYQANAGDEKSKPAESFDDRLLEIAKSYKEYGRVDDEMRWAPFLCRIPNPGVARVSASKDEDTHGQKLYSLLVKDHNSYFRFEKDKPHPVGQVIVKESWVPEEVTDADMKKAKVIVSTVKSKEKDKETSAGFEEKDHFLPYATKDGKTYHAAKQADLFIMFKMDPKTQDTDEGWVYGTVTPDGKKVTSAGKIESCMKCHQEAPHDRLFGMAKK